MKYIYLIITILILKPNNIIAQEFKDSFNVSIFGKKHLEIKYTINEKSKVSFFIETFSLSNKKSYLAIEENQIEDFKIKLKEVAIKFDEWTKLADSNNVLNLKKEMDIKIKVSRIEWKGSSWFFSFNPTIKPIYMITDGKPSLLFTTKVTASDNRYIDETVFIIFSGSEEINILIEKLDLNIAKNNLSELKDKSDLFK